MDPDAVPWVTLEVTEPTGVLALLDVVAPTTGDVVSSSPQPAKAAQAMNTQPKIDFKRIDSMPLWEACRTP
jgi:hypothetical protein